jgi:hypothetical protein
LDFRKTISERFPAAPLYMKRLKTESMIEIAIFPRSKMTITDGGWHPPYQSKKTPPNEISENDS